MKLIKTIMSALIPLILLTSCGNKPTSEITPQGEESTGIYLNVNGEIDTENHMFHKVKYKNTNQDTYVLGYLDFEFEDEFYIFNVKSSSRIIGYQELCDANYGAMDIKSGNNNTIKLGDRRKFGIEFNRNGDGRIRLYLINDPFNDSASNIANDSRTKIDINGSEGLPFNTVEKYTYGSDEYNDFTWFMRNPYAINCDENLEYIANNKDIEYITTSFAFKPHYNFFRVQVAYYTVNLENALIVSDDVFYDAGTFWPMSIKDVTVTITFIPFISLCIVSLKPV